MASLLVSVLIVILTYPFKALCLDQLLLDNRQVTGLLCLQYLLLDQ